MLLKGIPEAENASRPAGAAEMVLIRLSHAANLPAPEDAARRLEELSNGAGAMPNGGPAGGGGNGNGGGARAYGTTQAVASAQTSPQMQSAPQPTAMLRAVPDSRPQDMQVAAPRTEERPEPKVPVTSVQDIADLAQKNRDPVMRAKVRNFVRLVKIEPGRLDMRLGEGAPGSLPGELGVKLKEWTGIHWIVSLSKDEGEPTLVEAEGNARNARLVDARQDPDVAAILAQFPGAKITDVRIRAPAQEEIEDTAPPSVAESSEGDILPGDDIEF
jgi:DNA polymerase-3 subunit gamma/tau